MTQQFYLKVCVHVCTQLLSCVQLFATPRALVCQAPLSMGFPRQEYWTRLSFPPPGDHPDPGIEPSSLESPALAGGFFITNAPWELPKGLVCMKRKKQERKKHSVQQLKT